MVCSHPCRVAVGRWRGRQHYPDYGGRLRRARLGLLVALTPIMMLFVAFTSAYVVRQGLPTLDERHRAVCSRLAFG